MTSLIPRRIKDETGCFNAIAFQADIHSPGMAGAQASVGARYNLFRTGRRTALVILCSHSVDRHFAQPLAVKASLSVGALDRPTRSDGSEARGRGDTRRVHEPDREIATAIDP